MTMLALVLSLAQLDPRGGESQQQKGEESVLATYDLRSVLPRWDASTTWSQGLLVPPLADPKQELPSIESTLQYGDLAAFELHELMTQILSDELRHEDRDLSVEAQRLSVLAPTSTQEQVRSILEGLQMALAATAPVRVDILTLSEGNLGELVPANVLSQDDAARLISSVLARGAQHRSYAFELSAGRTAVLDALKRVPYLYDYDVEIAQAMMVFAPIMAETHEGTRLVLRGTAVSGGLRLSTLLLRSELLGKIEKRALTLKGMINHVEGGTNEFVAGPDGIQVPQVLERALAFDTLLPDGKALALTLESTFGSASLREIVVLRRMGGAMSSYVVRPIPRTNRTLIALNAELFRAPRLVASSEDHHDEQGVPQPWVVANFDGEASSFLLQWVKARFVVFRRFGPWILIVTDPAWDRDAGAQLDRLVKSVHSDARLLSVSIDLHAQGREAAFPVRVRLPVLEGSSAGVVIARGTTAVTGYAVEVAQGAAVPDPYVSSVFEGLSLAFSVQDTTLEASGLAELYDSPVATLDPGYGVLGPIERPEPRILRFDERVLLPEGQPGRARFGASSDRPDQPGLALELSVTAR